MTMTMAGPTALLGADEERGQDGRELLTAEEERDLARRRIAGDIAARDELVTRNLALAHDMAMARCRRHSRRDDAIQDAILGLIDAANAFDPGLGVRFGTFAYTCIRRELQRARWNRWSLIRVSIPVHVTMEAMALGRLERLAKPSPPALIAAARRALAIRTASDFVAGRDDDDPYDPASLSSPEPEDHDARLDDDEALARIAATMRFLTPKEATVIRLRFGLDDGRAWTLEEVGAEMGFTKERARQLEKSGLDRLRKALGRGEAA